MNSAILRRILECGLGSRHTPHVGSVFMEAIHHRREALSIDELRTLVAQYEPRLSSILDDLVSSGIDDPKHIIASLMLQENMEQIEAQQQLLTLVAMKAVVFIFPLPPHVSDLVAGSLRDGRFSFTTSGSDIPPHLREFSCQSTDILIFPETVKKLTGISAVASEGYENGTLIVRKGCLQLITVMKSHRKLKLFVHLIPHLPRNGEEEFMALGREDVEEIYYM
jgi:hypothetical protein